MVSGVPMRSFWPSGVMTPPPLETASTGHIHESLLKSAP